MFKSYFAKRKQRHLEVEEKLIQAARSKDTPQVNEEFWHDFKTGLDRKLNERLVPEFKARPLLSRQWNPVLAYAFVLMFVVGVLIFKPGFNPKPLQVIPASSSQEDLVAEIGLIDELDGISLNHDEEAYLDELGLFYELEEQ